MFKKIRPDTFKELVMSVFMLLSEFDPATFDPETGVDGSKIIASTTGGVTFADELETVDDGEDIDNSDKETMELKRIQSRRAHISGNFVTVNPTLAALLMAAVDVDEEDENHLIPRNDLKTSDFNKLWGLADYGKGGLIAIKMKRVLNTSGFSISTTDQSKAQFAFDFVCHKTIADPTDPPYEVYLLTPEEEEEEEEDENT